MFKIHFDHFAVQELVTLPTFQGESLLLAHSSCRISALLNELLWAIMRSYSLVPHKLTLPGEKNYVVKEIDQISTPSRVTDPPDEINNVIWSLWFNQELMSRSSKGK